MVNNKLLLTSFLVLISKIRVAESFSLRPTGSKNCLKELRLHVIRKQLSTSFSSDDDTNLSRRQWLNDFAVASIGISSVFVPSTSAYASGGATAGGAYLLSAKQRYNARVLAGMKSFLLLSSSLEDGNLAESKAFFESEDEGGWKDSSAAGYLLANAFRRNSSTPPDNLPSVKKWKAFSAELDVMQKSLKKKDVKKASASYKKAEILLDEYLEAVELPPVIEMRS